MVPVVEFISFIAELKDEREKRRLLPLKPDTRVVVVLPSLTSEFFKIDIGAA